MHPNNVKVPIQRNSNMEKQFNSRNLDRSRLVVAVRRCRVLIIHGTQHIDSTVLHLQILYNH